MKYSYEVVGGAADGQTWTATGTVSTDRAGDFPHVPSLAMREAFLALTKGRAVYGKPGVACRGPYSVTKLLIEAVPEE